MDLNFWVVLEMEKKSYLVNKYGMISLMQVSSADNPSIPNTDNSKHLLIRQNIALTRPILNYIPTYLKS